MQKAAGGIPRGVGAPPPPGMDPRHGRGKLMCIKVRMLDDSVAVFHLGITADSFQHKACGQALFDEVCRHLNLLECDYFGLEFIDGYGNRCWLEKDKSILRQITAAQSDARFYFICKFYTPNPTELEEEYTRYLLGLQIRRDLAHGELLCNENTAALLVSFIVQAECGDFSAEDYPDHTYLSVTSFVPNQTAAFQQKVMDNHRKLVGMGPGEADLALLETARRCDFYGIKLHAAKDIEGTDVALSVAHMGIKVFHQLNCISTFSWAKIRKLSFKRKRLMIKLHPESYQYYKETIEFNFDNRNECKNFWKKCVEHHAFFRCLDAPSFEFGAPAGSTAGPSSSSIAALAAITGGPPPKKDTKRLFSHGSSFRYQGRTQRQLIDFVREHRKRREPFQRPLRSNRAGTATDPYGVIGGTAQRKIQFNVLDPMLASSVSAGGFVTAPTSSAGPSTGQGRCCLTQTPRVHNQPSAQHSYNGAPIHGTGVIITDNVGGGDLSQRYPDVYYPPGAKPQQQAHLQQQQQVPYSQQRQQQRQYYHYHHYGNPQQQQIQQQQQVYYAYEDETASFSKYYHQPYDTQQQQLRQQQQQNYGGAQTAQRPRSVYATMTSTATTTAPTRHSDYNVSAAGASTGPPAAITTGIKNHRSSSDVASAGAVGMARPLRQQPRREDSVPPPLAEADEETTAEKPSASRASPPSDPMSTSLPNVLAEDLKVMCHKYRDNCAPVAAPPPKSMSGESFLDDLRMESRQHGGGGIYHYHQHHYHRQQQQRDALTDFIYDNMSEGSYRLGGGGAGGGNSSSTSDVGVESLSARALCATFTTKRVGNVIVKRVIDPNESTRQRIKAGDDLDDDESSYSESCCKMSSVSAPASSRYRLEQQQRPIRQRVPIPSTATDTVPSPDTLCGSYCSSPPRASADTTTATRLPHGDAIVNDVYLKNYVIEQDPAASRSEAARSILKNPSTTASGGELKPVTGVPRPVLLDDNRQPSFPTELGVTTTSILTRGRPVLVTPISVRNPASFTATNAGGVGSASSSTFSTPQPSVRSFATGTPGSQEHHIPIVTPGTPGAPSTSTTNGKPIVQGAKFTKLSTLADEDKSPKSAEANPLSTEQTQQEIARGIPGRVISKHNMVITPGGILPKEEIIGSQRSEKPKVPPKPKGIAKDSGTPVADDKTAQPPAQADKVDVQPTTESENAKLLEPLNAILNDQILPDSNNNKNRLTANTATTDGSQKSRDNDAFRNQEQKLYDQIRVSVQNEDEPDVRRMQTFGDGAQIPYTLTMRNIETPKSADKSADALLLLRKGRRQKVLDLVDRRQLPSQNSFSSQDHSISPTSADSGNIVEYIKRRRSLSNERCESGNVRPAITAAARKDRRRQTQPISLAEVAVKTQTSDTSLVEKKTNAPKASLDEDLPEPPPASLLVSSPASELEKTPDEILEDEAQKLAQNIVSGVLETDF